MKCSQDSIDLESLCNGFGAIITNWITVEMEYSQNSIDLESLCAINTNWIPYKIKLSQDSIDLESLCNGLGSVITNWNLPLVVEIYAW